MQAFADELKSSVANDRASGAKIVLKTVETGFTLRDIANTCVAELRGVLNELILGDIL